MADEGKEENEDTKQSSFEIIGRVWTSLTSNEDANDITETTVVGDTKNIELTDENEHCTSVNDEIKESSTSESIFSSIFSRFNSTDNESSSESDTNVSGELSRNSPGGSENNVTENSIDTPVNEAEKQQEGSLGILSNIISSLTSSDTEEGANLTPNERKDTSTSKFCYDNSDEQKINSLERTGVSIFTVGTNENTEDLSLNSEYAIASTTDITNDDVFDKEESIKKNDSFHERLRKSSSALFTDPENIDKNNLDYITFVSS